MLSFYSDLGFQAIIIRFPGLVALIYSTSYGKFNPMEHPSRNCKMPACATPDFVRSLVHDLTKQRLTCILGPGNTRRSWYMPTSMGVINKLTKRGLGLGLGLQWAVIDESLDGNLTPWSPAI
ncbi:hypothetical protein ACMFMG_011763 [Clarireedia jacksonii]